VLTVAELQQAGVKRISLGSALYGHAMAALQQAADALAHGDLASATTRLSSARITELIGRRPRPD
jgi:2-methylisocitrate lyase-like PEP mutase family enzyme